MNSQVLLNSYQTLVINSESYCIYQISQEQYDSIDWNKVPFFSFTRTKNEMSVLTLSGIFNSANKIEAGWKRLCIKGPIPFELSGILTSVLSPLAQMKISVLVISTFNTDYIFFKEADMDKTIKTLKQANFKLILQ